MIKISQSLFFNIPSYAEFEIPHNLENFLPPLAILMTAGRALKPMIRLIRTIAVMVVDMSASLAPFSCKNVLLCFFNIIPIHIIAIFRFLLFIRLFELAPFFEMVSASIAPLIVATASFVLRIMFSIFLAIDLCVAMLFIDY
jgi:hypothetical protein